MYLVLPDYPNDPKYHTMDDAWSCGASCVQMILRFAQSKAGAATPPADEQPPVTQDQLFKEIAHSTSNDLVDWTGGPDGMESVLRERLRDYIPGNIINYRRIYRERKYDVEKWIAGTLYQNRLPAIVLTGSSKGYSHWVLVYGCLLDKEPTGKGETTSGIKGFFIHSPMLPLTYDLDEHGKQVPHGTHKQDDSCGRPNDPGQDNIKVYHYVDIREWRRQYTPKGIPTFEGRNLVNLEGRNYIALVYGNLGDETPPGFTDDADKFSRPPTEGKLPEPPPKITEDEAKNYAVRHLDDMGLFNVRPWHEAIGGNLAEVLKSPNNYATAHYVERLDAHDITLTKPPHKVIAQPWHSYFLVQIKTDSDKSAIAVIIDSVTGDLLETLAVPNPKYNVLRVPTRNEILDKLRANIDKIDTTSNKKDASYLFTKIVSVENGMPIWRLDDIYSDINLAEHWGQKDKIDCKDQALDLVWSPSIETTSRFYPLYWLTHRNSELEENVYVRIDTPITDPEKVYAFTEINPIGRRRRLPVTKPFVRNNHYRQKIRIK